MAMLEYRLTVYEPRATQSNLTTEPDILYRTATVSGVANFDANLLLPEGRTSKLDLLGRKVDQGQMTFGIIDTRTTAGGSNASRTLTALLGQIKCGCKVKAEENVNGAGWVTWWTGRVEAIQLDGRNVLRLRCRDMLADLARHEVFLTRPNSAISYAAEPLLLPIGLSAAYGPQPAATTMGGTIASDGVYRTITLNGTSKGRADNVVTAALVRSSGIPFLKLGVPQEVRASSNLRVRFTAGAVTLKEAIVVKLEVQRRASIYQVNKLWIRALDSASDPYYTSITTGTIADATTVSALTVRQLSLNESGGEAPLLLDGVRGPQLVADLLDGKFGRLNADGTVNRTFPRDSGSSFTDLIADTSFPLLRFVISEPAKLKEWVEENVLRPCGLGWRVNASGEIVLLDLRPVTAIPSAPTITEADLFDGTAPEWELNRDNAVNVVKVTTFLDLDRDINTLGTALVPAVPTTLIDSIEVPRDIQVGDSYDLGTKRLEIICRGFRAFPNELIQNQDRAQWIDRQADTLAASFRQFGEGLIQVTLTCARTANTDVQVGGWALIDVDCLPDPATALRGGTRLMRCIERSDKGLPRRLRFLDNGPSNVRTAPTVATPAQEASNTANGITVAVTLNASSEVALLWINTTLTSVGTRPADTDPGWRLVTPIGLPGPYLYSTATYTVRPVAANKRHWVAVATAPIFGVGLGSARAYPAGTGYVDSATLTAPNTFAVGSISTKSALLTWVNGDATRGVELWLASGTSGANANAATAVRYRSLPPGTTAYQLTALDTVLPELGTAGPYYKPELYHVDGYGGYSSAAAIAGTNFQATGAATTAPTMAALLVTRDGASSPYPGPAQGGFNPAGSSGIELQLVVASTGLGLDVELERDDGAGGAFSQIAIIPSIGSVRQLYRDDRPQSSTTWRYRARQSGAGVSAGSYCAIVSATPGYLPLLAFGAAPSQPVLGVTIPDYLQAQDMIPSNTAASVAAVYGQDLTLTTTATAYFFEVAVRPKNGARLVGWTMGAKRVNAGDTAEAKLYTVSLGGAPSLIATLTKATGAGYGTISGTFTQDLTANYYIELQLKANAATADCAFGYIKLDYSYDADTKG